MRSPRPWHFFFLILPYGASSGFVGVALPFLARERGISVTAISTVVAISFLPHTPKFLWAPVVDSIGSRKRWYLTALVLVSVGTFASMAMPIAAASLGALAAVVFASQFGLTLMGMACEGLIGRSLPAEAKGRAASFFMAGMYMGAGLGGGAAIELVTRLGGAAVGAGLGLLFGACALPLVLFDEAPDPDRQPLRVEIRRVFREIGAFAGSRGGLAILVICASPVGSGAASNLFGAIAEDWHASRNLVALSTGLLGNVVSAAGAASAAFALGRLRRRTAYALAGALTATVGLCMALAPHRPWAYAVFTFGYQALNGMSFAAFSALAFEAAGRGAVATKYNVLAGLVNASIAYTTRVDGAAHQRWGGSGVLVADAAMTGVGVVVFALAVLLAKVRGGPVEGAEAERAGGAAPR
jgi:hypothetical protein